MRLEPTRQPRNIINDDDGLEDAVFTNKGQHVLHAGPLGNAPRKIVLEISNNAVALRTLMQVTRL